MQINRSQFPSIEQVAGELLEKKTGSSPVPQSGQSFAQILNQKQILDASPLKFSKHAAERLSERNISLSQNQINRLSRGAEAAGEKGINDSLVLMDQLAFIVNVKNQTVITAMDQNDTTRQNVFTNIDGAVIV